MQVKDLFKLEGYEDFYYQIMVNGLVVVVDLRERAYSVLSAQCLTSAIDSFTVDFNDSTVIIRIIVD